MSKTININGMEIDSVVRCSIIYPNGTEVELWHGKRDISELVAYISEQSESRCQNA